MEKTNARDIREEMNAETSQVAEKAASGTPHDAMVKPVPIEEILERKEALNQSSLKSMLKDKKDTDSKGIKQAQSEPKSTNSATQKETDLKGTLSSEITFPDAAEKASTSDTTDQPFTPNKTPLHEDPDFLKLQDSFDKTRKWGRDLSKKIHGFKRQVESYLQEGILTEEEAESLLKGTDTHTEEEDHPLLRYSKIWDAEIHNIKKYTRDQSLDQNILAFQHLLRHADQDELSSLLEELSSVEKDSLELTHKMLQMGKDYHASTYGPLTQAGGMQNMLKTHRQETQKLQQQIDKLRQELVKLRRSSEIDTAGYSLPDGGSFGTITGDTLSLGGILKKGLSGR